MKKITILVPNEIDRCLGSAGRMIWSKHPITPENIKKLLCENIDYHDYLIFKDMDQVRVLSIEDVGPENMV